MAKKLMGCPAWLKLSEDKTSFIYLPERAAIVRKIFELSISGVGGYSIAKRLNEEGVPAFGPSPIWHQSTIHNMLRNRATIGEYQAAKFRKGRPSIEDSFLANFYPPVIDESVFQAAQEARQNNLTAGRGRKGFLITNLFGGLASCFYCNGPIRFHSNGSAKRLVCESALAGSGCHRFAWTYRDFENAFFRLAEIDVRDGELATQIAKLNAGGKAPTAGEVRAWRSQIAGILKRTVVTLTIAAAGAHPPAEIRLKTRIQRDHPDRFFEVTFLNSGPNNGYPAISASPRLQDFEHVKLAKSLGLSPRQGELAALLAAGLKIPEAAKALGLSLATARWHLRSIFARTGVNRQADVVDLAVRFLRRPSE